METREILCTFSNGGKLVRLKKSQKNFLDFIKPDMIQKKIQTRELSLTGPEYVNVILSTSSRRRYNTGKDERMLNELRNALSAEYNQYLIIKK
jgi:hypothetical protein